MSEIQDPAPVNETVQELPDEPSEPIIEQPQASMALNNAGFKIFSLMATIFTWQPVGLRVVIDLPSITDNVNPLAIFVANPLQMHPYYILRRFPLPGTTIGFLQNNLITAFTPNFYNPGVVFTWYGPPCLMAIFGMIYRRWRGPIKFMLRATGSFVNFGNVTMSPSYNTNIPPQVCELQYPNATGAAPKAAILHSFGYSDSQQNSTVISDVSSQRHMQVEVGYNLSYPWFDQFQYFADCLPLDTPALTNTMLAGTRVGNFQHSCAVLSNLNTISATTSAGGNFIAYELYMAAGEGFEFSDRHVMPNIWEVIFPSLLQSPINDIVYPRTASAVPSATPGYTGMTYGTP